MGWFPSMSSLLSYYNVCNQVLPDFLKICLTQTSIGRGLPYLISSSYHSVKKYADFQPPSSDDFCYKGLSVFLTICPFIDLTHPSITCWLSVFSCVVLMASFTVVNKKTHHVFSINQSINIFQGDSTYIIVWQSHLWFSSWISSLFFPWFFSVRPHALGAQVSQEFSPRRNL